MALFPVLALNSFLGIFPVLALNSLFCFWARWVGKFRVLAFKFPFLLLGPLGALWGMVRELAAAFYFLGLARAPQLLFNLRARISKFYPLPQAFNTSAS